MVVLKSLIDDTEHNPLSGKGRFQSCAGLDAIDTRVLACRFHQGTEAACQRHTLHLRHIGEGGQIGQGEVGSHVSSGDGCGLVAVGLEACHHRLSVGDDEGGGERLMGGIGLGTVVEGVGDGASGGALPAVFGQ